MIISVHLPKTGGYAFKTLLEEQYGKHLLLDYADRPMSHNTFSRNWTAIKNNFRARPLSDIQCIHGHFLPCKYTYLSEQSRFVIWLRDPVERIVSHYYYWKRTDDTSITSPLYHKMINENMSLEQFCQLPRFWNFYSKYLFNFDIANFSFIGLTENYDQSFNSFCRMFNIENSEPLLRQNHNIHRKGEKYDIPQSLRQYIEKKNKKDYQIYALAQRLNAKLLTDI